MTWFDWLYLAACVLALLLAAYVCFRVVEAERDGEGGD